MKHFSNLISYFKACYQSDNRETQIVDFLSNKIEFPLFLEEAELLQGSLDYYPVNSEWAAETSKNLRVYSKEKELIIGSFFLVGKVKINNKIQHICAPLFINGVIIHYSDELFTIELDSDENQLNPGIIASLQTALNISANTYDILNEALPKGKIRFDEIVQIEEVVNQSFTNINTSHLQSFPKLFDKNQLTTLYEKLTIDDPIYLIPAIGLGILKKSSLSRGVLNELTEISQAKNYAAPLRELFFPQKFVAKKIKSSLHYIPANLSTAQTKILDSIETHASTLVIGPPGTGKSFTIATIAIDALSKGKSVLIAAKTDQAVDVIANKIENDFGLKDLIIRGGKKDYKRKLKHRIENILSGIGAAAPSSLELKDLQFRIQTKLELIEKMERACVQREKMELQRGNFLEKRSENWYHQLQNWWIKKRLDRETPYWNLVNQLESAIQEKNRLVNSYVQKKYYYELHHTLRRHRKEFQKLNSALRARTGGKKALLFQNIDFSILYRVLPVWLVATTEINNILPLYKEMFDVVVIDEATQCDIASALPLLFRAKKMVVVGDPKQLRHVSFISNKRQAYLINQYQVNSLSSDILNYRENSLLDLVLISIKNQDQVHFLDEHYRSLPDIITFSNHEFYDNTLKIMTESPLSDHEKNIELVICEGKRSKSGYNKAEAERILILVNEYIEKETSLVQSYCQSIGILSPFREQVEYIRKQIEKHLSFNDLQRHNILIGTPYSFQGEERDVMFLSLTIDPDIHPSTLQYLNKEDVLNVAITRARTRQFVLLSTEVQDLNRNYLLVKYLHHINNNNNINIPARHLTNDHFAQEIKHFLLELGVTEILEHYPLAGSIIDLVVLHEDNTFSIDLVGFPGVYQNAYAIEKYKLLSRIGIKTMVIPYSSWVIQQAKVKNMLKTALNR